MRRFPRLRPLALGLCLAALSGSGLAQSNERGIDPANFDRSVDACQDFYQFANGGWLANNPVPADRSLWGLFDELQERSRDVQREILDEAAKARAEKGSVRQQLGDFWASGLDQRGIERAGFDPIRDQLASIAALASSQDILAFLRDSGAQGNAFLYGVATLGDMKNSDMEMAYLMGTGLGLPDRDYYTRDDDDARGKQDAYRTHIARILGLIGVPEAEAGEQAQQVYAIEDRLARVSMTRHQRRDAGNFYRPISVEAAEALAPGLAWGEFLAAQGLADLDRVSYASPGYFAELEFMLKDVPVEHWRAYLSFHLADDAAPYLSKAFADAHFDFYSRILRGQDEQRPRWQRVLDTISGSMGEAVGQLIGYQLRLDLYRKLQQLSLAWHDRAHTGDLMTRGIIDIEGVRLWVDTGILRMVLLTILIGGGAVVLLRNDLVLGLVALSFVPVVGVRASFARLKLRDTWIALQDQMSLLTKVMEENLGGIRVVRAFAAQDHELRRYDRIADEALRTAAAWTGMWSRTAPAPSPKMMQVVRSV